MPKKEESPLQKLSKEVGLLKKKVQRILFDRLLFQK